MEGTRRAVTALLAVLLGAAAAPAAGMGGAGGDPTGAATVPQPDPPAEQAGRLPAAPADEAPAPRGQVDLQPGALGETRGPLSGLEASASMQFPEGISHAEPATHTTPPVAALGETLLQTAWRHGGSDLPRRAGRVREVALQLGIWSLDPAARAVLLDASAGTPLERGEAAALLAPELPDAHFALARARLGAGDLSAAGDALAAAFGRLGRHPESALWLRATLVDAAARIAVVTGLLFLVLAGVAEAASPARGLAQRIGWPLPSSAAALGCALLAPAALGEGMLGVAVAAGGVAAARGGGGMRAAVAGAVTLLLVGLFPLGDRRDAALSAIAADPVAAAAQATERDFPSPLDLARLGRAAGGDPLARRALALAARRSGDLEGAERGYAELLAAGDPDPSLLNNAANARVAAGRPDEAFDLYERAAREEASPLLLFNLAQAYGRAILLEEQDLALSQAQALDPRAVHMLTALASESGEGGPVDVPISLAELPPRHASPAAGTSLRRRFAPGWLGASPPAAVVGLLVAAALATAAGRTAARLPARSAPAALRGAPGSAPRLSRLAALRAREARLGRLRRAAGLLVPGAAGLQAGSPLLGLACALAAVAAAALFEARAGAVPDALAAGDAGAFFLCAAAAAAALAYAAGLALCVALARRRS